MKLFIDGIIAAAILSIAEFHDITTIYPFYGEGDNTTVECHARTSAQGYPILMDNVSKIDRNLNGDLPPCSPKLNESLCSNWTLTNWEFLPSLNVSTAAPPLYMNQWSGVTEENNFTELLPFVTPAMRVDVKNTREDNIVFICLSNGMSLNDDIYVLQITSSRAYIYKCRSSYRYYYSRLQMPGGVLRDDCRQGSNRYVDSNWASVSSTYRSLNISVSNQQVSFMGLTFYDSEPILVKYMKLGSTKSIYYRATLDTRIMSLVTKKGTLRSLQFIPKTPTICLAIIYFLSNGTSNEISVDIDVDGELRNFGTLSNSIPDQNGKWKSKRFLLETTPGIRQQVVITGKRDSIDSMVAIQRVSECNAKEHEDILVGKVQQDGENDIWKCKIPKSNIQTSPEKIIEEKGIDCYNGGILDIEDGKCQCPPGFVSKYCETGCGNNRYGNDCGGLCSGSSSGCRGMRLCRELVGCDCAPGFKGANCSESCDAWEYGTGCKLRCGHCSGSPCDAFTGECPGGCEEGFRAPLCIIPYTFVKSSPQLVQSSFREMSVSISLDADNFRGDGNPKFYQIQSRMQIEDEWKQESPCSFPAKTSEKSDIVVVHNITNLSPGRKFAVRVILYDDDGSSYKGEQVPELTAETKCIVPENFDYNPQPKNITSMSFSVTWNAWPGEDSEYCPLLSYKVYLRDALRWTIHGDTMVPAIEATGRIPDTEYEVKIETLTVTGRVSKSKILVVKTREGEPSAVVNLRVNRKDAEEVELQWNKPLHSGRNVRIYEVSYKCLSFIAKCPLSCRSSKGRLNVTAPSVILHDLLPFAQYEVKVSAYNDAKGRAARFLMGTRDKVPDIAPELSENPVVNRTNTSFVLKWNPPGNCSLVNGFLAGYMYEVRTLGENSSRLRSRARSTTAFVGNLMPYTEYDVRVYVLSSGGWNPEAPLIISAKTRPAVPDVVQNLTVYKKGRNTVGIRWSPPEEAAGNLTGFSISYEEDGTTRTVTAGLKPCKPWPSMYCHTLKGLRFETEYYISVRGMNEEVNDQGETASIKATTVEGAPDSPPYLRVISKTSSTLRVEWGHPLMVNGILRSFLINVEQVDTYNSSECCKYYPIAEHLVRTEEESYQYEFSDLDPASTYTVSVSAKTVSMGPAVTLTASTKPPTPLMVKSPSVLKEAAGNGVVNVTIEAPQEYNDLTSAYFFLVFPQESSEETGGQQFNSPDIQEEVSALVNKSFYVAGELSKDVMERTSYMTLGTEQSGNGSYSAYRNPSLRETITYSVGLLLILDYLSERSYGFAESEEFSIPPS